MGNTYKCTICGFTGSPEEFKSRHTNHIVSLSEKSFVNESPRPEMLFVDDRTKRIHYALENFPNYKVTIATCVSEALRQMVKQKWAVISLDHDLNGHDFQDPDTPTCGMEIVRYIVKTGWPRELGRPEFWIHSSNLFAAHLMITTLKKAGHVAYWHKIEYKVENMKYDSKGIPAGGYL